MTAHSFSRGRAVRGLTFTATAVLIVCTAGLLGTPTASADSAVATQIYDLSSEAVALQTTMTDPGLPFGIPFSIGSYGAGTVLNSNGESFADAGAPYSPLVSSFPNTGNGLAQSVFGQGLPVVPTFPGYVSAKDPVLPTATQNAGGYELVATALPTAASGKVSLGGQAATSEENNAFAVSNSTVETDRIFTEGAAGVHALTLSGILDIFNVSSYASLTKQSGGEVVPVTTTSLGTITFAGLQSGVTDKGASVFGAEPTPITVEGMSALNEALKPAGVTLAYLPQEYRYADGSTSIGPTVNAKKEVAAVTSGGLRIFLSNTTERGTTTETITVGRISVSAAGASLDDSPASAVRDRSAGIDVAGAPGAGVPATADLAGLAGLGAPSGAVPAGALPAANFVPAVAAGGLNNDGRTSWESFYLFVILGGTAALIGGQAVRLVAVRRSA